jgi:hypothetical protein
VHDAAVGRRDGAQAAISACKTPAVVAAPAIDEQALMRCTATRKTANRRAKFDFANAIAFGRFIRTAASLSALSFPCGSRFRRHRAWRRDLDLCAGADSMIANLIVLVLGVGLVVWTAVQLRLARHWGHVIALLTPPSPPQRSGDDSARSSSAPVQVQEVPAAAMAAMARFARHHLRRALASLVVQPVAAVPVVDLWADVDLAGCAMRTQPAPIASGGEPPHVLALTVAVRSAVPLAAMTAWGLPVNVPDAGPTLLSCLQAGWAAWRPEAAGGPMRAAALRACWERMAPLALDSAPQFVRGAEAPPAGSQAAFARHLAFPLPGAGDAAPSERLWRVLAVLSVGARACAAATLLLPAAPLVAHSEAASPSRHAPVRAMVLVCWAKRVRPLAATAATQAALSPIAAAAATTALPSLAPQTRDGAGVTDAGLADASFMTPASLATGGPPQTTGGGAGDGTRSYGSPGGADGDGGSTTTDTEDDELEEIIHAIEAAQHARRQRTNGGSGAVTPALAPAASAVAASAPPLLPSAAPDAVHPGVLPDDASPTSSGTAGPPSPRTARADAAATAEASGVQSPTHRVAAALRQRGVAGTPIAPATEPVEALAHGPDFSARSSGSGADGDSAASGSRADGATPDAEGSAPERAIPAALSHADITAGLVWEFERYAVCSDHSLRLEDVFMPAGDDSGAPADGGREPAAASGAPTCVVCLTDPASVITLPCRHYAVCGGCHQHVSQCPICRAPFHGHIERRALPVAPGGAAGAGGAVVVAVAM